MAQYAVEGEDYVEVNMMESTNFYMNWEDFAPTYRAEYCEFSGIDPASCSNYTENDMVEKVWGGKENAEATKYRVGPLCSRAGEIIETHEMNTKELNLSLLNTIIIAKFFIIPYFIFRKVFG